MALLDLSANPALRDRGAIALSKALEKVKRLLLHDCGILADGTTAIQEKLDSGANLVTPALMYQSHLQTLNMPQIVSTFKNTFC